MRGISFNCSKVSPEPPAQLSPLCSLLTETSSPALSSFLWFPETLLILQCLQLVFLCLVLGFLFLQTLMCTLPYSLGGSSSLFLVAHTLESFHRLQLPAWSLLQLTSCWWSAPFSIATSNPKFHISLETRLSSPRLLL